MGNGHGGLLSSDSKERIYRRPAGRPQGAASNGVSRNLIAVGAWSSM
jgi:hypothetical protein